MVSLSRTLIFFAAMACSRAEFKTPKITDSQTIQEAPLGPPMIAVGDASAEQCASGGTVLSVFNDSNSNGIFEESENLIRRQIVCNGADGANGADGSNGADGEDGVSGTDGYSMVFETTAAPVEECAAGGSILVMALDSDRSGTLSIEDQNFLSVSICNGANGSNGSNGQDGEDGSDGADGENAALTRFTPVDIITACGETSPYKEILLRLHGGQVLASFSSNVQGDMTRLAFLPDGTYMNTDSSGCIFSLSTSVDGTTRTVSWGNQVQSTWPLL